MKNRMLIGIVVIASSSIMAVNIQQAAITGRVSPANAAEVVWVIGAKDSIRATISSGNFSVMVKPGTYKIIVDAKEPFKDALLDNLDVKSNEPLDVGEIILQQ
jgi:hypothetical protein